MATNGGHGDSPQIEFVSLGMFIIDEIEFATRTVHDVLGGAGTYSAIGARIVSPPPASKSVGWIVDAGHDFPAELRDVINSWDTSCLIRSTPWRKTTRGWNGYGENEHRAFKYTTPKLRLDHDSLDDNLLLSKSFHLICSPERCIDLVENILRRRKMLDNSQARHDSQARRRPLFIWEPVPDLCVPDQLQACRAALQHVDVISPNHTELCGFFGVEAHNTDGSVERHNIMDCCQSLLDVEVDAGISQLRAVVVRSGKEGCYIATKENTAWLPAYHQNSEKVVDPTGGGNTFLGGFSITLARASTIDFAAIENAVVYGAVAASFAIEQIGMPTLGRAEGEETWNDDSVGKRIRELQQRISSSI